MKWKSFENCNQRIWGSNDNQTIEEIKLHKGKKERKKERKKTVGGRETNLAAQRTEPERIKEASATNLTGVGDTLSRPGLWALIQKYNLGTVDNIGLNARYVDELLNFINPHHVVVRGSSYLQQPPMTNHYIKILNPSLLLRNKQSTTTLKNANTKPT